MGGDAVAGSADHAEFTAISPRVAPIQKLPATGRIMNSPLAVWIAGSVK
jgi:hypothetical protein